MVSCQDIWIENDEAIIAAWDVNRIYRLDLQSGVNQKISAYEPKNRKLCVPYGRIYKYSENKFLFSPVTAREILIYDAKTEVCRYIPLEECEGKNWLNTIVPYGKYLFLIPLDYNAIVRFDCETEEVSYIRDCISEMNLKYGKDEEDSYRSGYALIEDDLYLINAGHKGIVLKINLLTYRYEFIELEDSKNMISICGDGDTCWIVCDNGDIIEWIPKKNELRQYINESGSIEGRASTSILKRDNLVIALPWMSRNFIVLDLNTGSMSSMEVIKETERVLMCLCEDVSNGYLYTFSYITKKLYKISLAKLVKEAEYSIDYPEDDEIEVWEGYVPDIGFAERNEQSLQQYIKYVQAEDCGWEYRNMADKIGGTIWEESIKCI